MSTAASTHTNQKTADHATQSAQLALSELTLLGVFGPGDGQRALMRLASGRVRQVGPGDRIGGATVKGIDTDRITLVRLGRDVVLEIPGD